MLDSYVAAILVQSQYSWQQGERGRIEYGEYGGVHLLVRRINSDSWGMTAVWNRMRQGALDPEFVNAVQRELEERLSAIGRTSPFDFSS